MISVQNTKNSGEKAAGDTRVGGDSLCWHVDGVWGGIDLLLVCAAPGTGFSCKWE